MQPTHVTIGELNIAVYERPGKGIPIVFIHGNSSNAHAFEHAWEDKALSDFHLLAFDMPGHGNSDFASDISQYTILGLSKLVGDVVNKKQLKNAVLVGHSISGHISTHALRFTNNVTGIMQVGSAPLANAAAMAEGYILSEDILALFKKEATEDELVKALELEVHHRKFQSIIRSSYAKTDGRCREVMAGELGTFFTSDNFVSEIDLLKRPGLKVAFVLGDREKLINVKYLENLPINKWRGNVQVVTESAHCPVFENPVEFAELVAAFARDVEKSLEVKPYNEASVTI